MLLVRTRALGALFATFCCWLAKMIALSVVPASVMALALVSPTPVPEQTKPPTRPHQRQSGIAPPVLTRGQVNAVRAAFKAGVTPVRIARQFGLSSSQIRKTLMTDEPRR